MTWSIVQVCVGYGENITLSYTAPKQPEQEYIVKYLKKQGYFYYVNQKDLNLLEDINKSKEFKGFIPEHKTKESIKKFIELLNLK